MWLKGEGMVKGRECKRKEDGVKGRGDGLKGEGMGLKGEGMG